jgi:hypothetical protein
MLQTTIEKCGTRHWACVKELSAFSIYHEIEQLIGFEKYFPVHTAIL